MRKMLLIYNPKSGRQEFALNLADVVNKFTQAKFLVTVYPTQREKDSISIIRRYADKFDTIVCSGGDGTINEVLNAVMSLKNAPPVGYIPSGTTNDFAHTLGIPSDILLAADVIINGEVKSIDAGLFCNKYFAYVAAFGLFTDVPYATSQTFKNIFGHMAYILEGAKRLTSINPIYCDIDIDGEAFSGDFILGIISNSSYIAGLKTSDSFMLLDDGLFEIVLIKNPENFIDMQKILFSINTNQLNDDWTIYRRAKSIKIKTKKAIKWTLDGEFGGKIRNATILNYPRKFKIYTQREEKPLPPVINAYLE